MLLLSFRQFYQKKEQKKLVIVCAAFSPKKKGNNAGGKSTTIKKKYIYRLSLFLKIITRTPFLPFTSKPRPLEKNALLGVSKKSDFIYPLVALSRMQR